MAASSSRPRVWRALERIRGASVRVDHFHVIPLDPADYVEVVREMAVRGWRSGRIYGALHLRCARKHPIDRVYTYNEKDYRACAPEDWKDRNGEP